MIPHLGSMTQQPSWGSEMEAANHGALQRGWIKLRGKFSKTLGKAPLIDGNPHHGSQMVGVSWPAP